MSVSASTNLLKPADDWSMTSVLSKRTSEKYLFALHDEMPGFEIIERLTCRRFGHDAGGDVIGEREYGNGGLALGDAIRS